jgi:hypothetical protein
MPLCALRHMTLIDSAAVWAEEGQRLLRDVLQVARETGLRAGVLRTLQVREWPKQGTWPKSARWE